MQLITRRVTGRRLAALTLAASLALTACGGGESNTTDEPDAGDGTDTSSPTAGATGGEDADLPTIVMGAPSASMSYTVPQLVESLELDHEHGFEMDYRPTGTSSVNLVSGVMGGDYDFAAPAANTVLEAMREGAELEIVAGALNVASILALRPEVIEQLDVDADASAEDRIRALEGLNIVTSGEGSGNNTFLRLMVASVGMSPSEDLTITGVNDTSAIIAGLRQGQFDGAFYGSGVIENNIADGSAELWISLPRGDVPVFEDLVGMTIVTSQETAEQDPELVASVHAAMADAVAAIEERPDEVGEVLKEDWFPDLDQEVFDLAWAEAQYAYPSGATFTQANFDKLTGILSQALGNDYSDLAYDQIVHEAAQG